jgi:uncharacterized protein YjbI with pentapeptide repeats
MADQPQLKRLRKGVEAWNTWRGQHPDIPLDLRGANLSNADLSEANLSYVNLSEALQLHFFSGNQPYGEPRERWL